MAHLLQFQPKLHVYPQAQGGSCKNLNYQDQVKEQDSQLNCLLVGWG